MGKIIDRVRQRQEKAAEVARQNRKWERLVARDIAELNRRQSEVKPTRTQWFRGWFIE